MISKPEIRTQMTSFLCLVLMTVPALILPTAQALADSTFSPQALERSMLDLYCQYPEQPSGACPVIPPPSPHLSHVVPAPTVPATVPASPPLDMDGGVIPNPVAAAPVAPPDDTPLTPADRGVWALEIFDQIAMLDTAPYNDVLTHLAADYRQHPEHRSAIELVLNSAQVEHSVDVTGINDHTADAMRLNYRELMRANRTRNPMLTVMDDVLVVFTVAYTFQFGRGLFSGGRTILQSSSEGLSRLDRFRRTVQMVVESDRIAQNWVKLNRLRIFAAGLGVGLTQAAIEAFSTYKIDSRHILEPVQSDIVHAIAVRAAIERDEMRAILRESDADLRRHASAYQDRITTVDRDVTQMQGEMAHLYNIAPRLLPQWAPISEDLTEIRLKLAQINRKLDMLDLPTLGDSPLN